MIVTFICHNQQQHDAAWQLGRDLGLKNWGPSVTGQSNVCLELSNKRLSDGPISNIQDNPSAYGQVIDLEAPPFRIPGIPYDITIGDTDVKIGCQTFSKTAILALAKEVK